MLDFDMGAYGGFIWPCFGATAVVFVALTVRAALQNKRWKRELRRLEAERIKT